MSKRLTVDRTFVFIVAFLVVGGFILFLSALMGTRVRSDINHVSLAINQLVGLGLGVGGAIFMSYFKHTKLKQYSFYIFLISIIITLLVFVPGLGVEHGGAKRWIGLGPVSLQPVEFLKIGFIIYFAALLSALKTKINSFRDGILPILIVLGIVSAILLAQPDTGSLVTIFAAAIGMYMASGGRFYYIITLVLGAITGVGILAIVRPYVRERIMTFIDPSVDPLGAGYQIQQSLIAIGSGGSFGRGFGQSVQKFSYLPEPVGDSIFAVTAEEFGFFGCFILIAVFCAFAFRGLHIAQHATNKFGGLMVVGIVILVVIQSFVNIASMLGVIPLTGMPLIFVSHGGSALVFTLTMLGIVFNVSKYKKKLI